jgi:O-antigen ligase
MAFLAFVCGLVSPVKLSLVGDIYLTEIILVLAAGASFASPRESRLLEDRSFHSLLLAALATLAGYILSDLVQGSRPDQYLRGWGRVLLVILDFLCLSVLASRSRMHLWWFVLGAGIGGVLYLRFVTGAPLALWKFGYADPIGLIAAAAGGMLPLRLASLGFAALGLKSIVSDYRSFGAICFLIATYLWVRAANPSEPFAGSGRMLKLALAGVAALGITVALLSATDTGGNGRRDESNAGRRAAIEVGLIAVAESPLIGHGSWTEDKALAKLFLKRQLELRGLKDAGWEAGTTFSPHSQVLHAWVEGGLLGTVFFWFLLYSLLKNLGWFLQRRPLDILTPSLLMFVVITLWNLFMSPFSAPHRVFIAVGALVAVLMAMERREASEVSRTSPIGESTPRLEQSPTKTYSALSGRRIHWRSNSARVCMRKTSGARMKLEK